MRKPGAREAAYAILNRVEGGSAFADYLLEDGLKGLREEDAALATELVYGVLRWKLTLDWAIDAFSTVKSKKLEHRVANALRLGAYQLLFLTRVPASAAVNESVALVKKWGERKAGFVNAVLRKIGSEGKNIKHPDIGADPVRHISVVYSHPEWLVKRWVARWGAEETLELCKSGQQVPPKTLRVNTLKSTRDGLIQWLSKSGLEAEPTRYSPDGIAVKGGRLEAKDERYYIQDEGSQLVSYVLSPRPGHKVLDACSAPGGKTTHLAQLMKNEGEIYALDVHASRLKNVSETAQRLGASIVKTFEADASTPFDFKTPEGGFDAVLCDAPCSGLGVLRRSPDMKWRRGEGDIKELSKRQAGILENLSAYVKRGGAIVYSTCTFEPEETDDVVADFLSRRGDFRLESAGGYVPEDCRVLVDEPGILRTYPHRHGMDGFFAARLKRF